MLNERLSCAKCSSQLGIQRWIRYAKIPALLQLTFLCVIPTRIYTPGEQGHSLSCGHWVSCAQSSAWAQSGHWHIFAEWVMCPTHQRPSASLGTPTTELSLPTRWDSSYGTHNVPHVPLDTVIWTVSLPCLRWVSNPGPPFHPAPAPSNL